jgi:hypothetical protein
MKPLFPYFPDQHPDHQPNRLPDHLASHWRDQPMQRRLCRFLLSALSLASISAALLVAQSPSAQAQSAILESVKRNPGKAKALCQQLRQLNAQGISATSRQAVNLVAQQQNLSPMDAEVLTTYVVGLHCPDVR